MNGWEIAPARLEDVAAIAAIEVAASKQFVAVGMPEVVVDALPAATLLAYREAAARGDVLVARGREGLIAGFAVLGLMDGEPYLAELDVHPDLQRQGIGRLLMNAAEGWAREKGGPSLLLATFNDVPWNGPFYERLGFKRVPFEDTSAGLQMKRQREREAAGGLDMSRRVFMRKAV